MVVAEDDALRRIRVHTVGMLCRNAEFLQDGWHLDASILPLVVLQERDQRPSNGHRRAVQRVDLLRRGPSRRAGTGTRGGAPGSRWCSSRRSAPGSAPGSGSTPRSRTCARPRRPGRRPGCRPRGRGSRARRGSSPGGRGSARARPPTPTGSTKLNISTLSNWWTRKMPARVAAGGAGLAAEAGREARVAERQLVGVEDLRPACSDGERDLRGPDQEELVLRDLVDHLPLAGEEAGPVQRLLADEHRRGDGREALGRAGVSSAKRTSAISTITRSPSR